MNTTTALMFPLNFKFLIFFSIVCLLQLTYVIFFTLFFG